LWCNAATMLPAGGRPASSWMHYTTSCNTQSSAPEDGQNNCSKHVELTGIINKPLLLHLVGCLYYLCQWCTVKQIWDNEIYLLIKYMKTFLWRAAKRLSCIEDAWCLKVNTKYYKIWPHDLHHSYFLPSSKWYSDRILLQCFCFRLSISIPKCSLFIKDLLPTLYDLKHLKCF
jgi:hypothetical protein